MPLSEEFVEGDPLADKVIADLVATGQVDEVNAVLSEFRGNDEPIPENLPPSVREVLIVTDDPPEWADAERIAGAYEFFVDDGVHVASVLSFGAMISCYAQPRPSRVPALPHRLDQPHRRMSETSQFVLNMMAPNPFGTVGVRAHHPEDPADPRRHPPFPAHIVRMGQSA